MSKNTSMDRSTSLAVGKLAKTDLHLLSVFMTVAESGGFSAAQVALNVGQSTISRHMADLEARLAMRLCQRGRIGFRLTDKGKMVYRACQRLFGALESFRADVGAISGQLVGELSLAVVDNWVADPDCPLPNALNKIKASGPNLHINIHALAPDDIELAVLDGRVALGIGVFHQHRPGLDYEHLCYDPLELYCGRGHPLFDAALKGAVPKDLGSADYARRGYLVEEKVAPLTARLPSTATVHQMEGVAHLILTGTYIGYLPVSYAARWVEEERMRSLLPKVYRLQTEIEIVTRKSVALSLVCKTFVGILTTAPDS